MGKHRFVIDGQRFDVEVHARAGDHADVTVNGKRLRVALEGAGDAARESRRVSSASAPAPRAGTKPSAKGTPEMRAPMAGRVLAIHAEAGRTLSRGEPVVVLDAMKMENSLAAPADGVVDEVLVKPGDTVLQGALLLRLR